MFIKFLITFIHVFVQLFQWLLFLYIILSWFAAGQTYFGELLSQVVEPFLRPFRWARIGRLSLAPILAYIVIVFVAYDILIPLLVELLPSGRSV